MTIPQKSAAIVVACMLAGAAVAMGAIWYATSSPSEAPTQQVSQAEQIQLDEKSQSALRAMVLKQQWDEHKKNQGK